MYLGKKSPQHMQIDLEYKGVLPSAQNGKDHRSAEKQEIRLIFSGQLKRKWRDSPQLSQWDGASFPIATRGGWHYESPDSSVPFFRVQTCGFDAVPLVSWHNGLECKLAITIVGDTRSASAVIGDGDVDNRLKVLFDALRIPHEPKEVPGNMFGNGAERMYCLLEDDSLIQKFSVEAVQSPCSPAEHVVRLRVTVQQMDGTHDALAGFR